MQNTYYSSMKIVQFFCILETLAAKIYLKVLGILIPITYMTVITMMKKIYSSKNLCIQLMIWARNSIKFNSIYQKNFY